MPFALYIFTLLCGANGHNFLLRSALNQNDNFSLLPFSASCWLKPQENLIILDQLRLNSCPLPYLTSRIATMEYKCYPQTGCSTVWYNSPVLPTLTYHD